MANDGSVDVLIQKQAIENVAIANKALELTLKNILAINEASRKGAAGSDNNPQSAEKINKANQASIKRLELADQTLVMRKKLIQSEKALGNAMTAENAKIVQNRTEIARRNKIVKEATKINSALTGAYEKLSLKLNQLRRRYKDVAITEGTASKGAIRLRKELEKLDSRLKKVDASAGQFQRNVGNYPKQMGAAVRGLMALGRALGVVGGLFLAIRVARDTFDRIRQFDKAMQNIAGIIGTTRKELKSLERTIIEVSGSSVRTSNQVAELAETLITLGKTKSEVEDLLGPVNDLSIGLEATSQEAGELLIQTLNAFGQGSEEAQRFADIIAKMRTSTALDFERIKDSLAFVAPTAKALGLTLEETGALLGVLVDNGIKAARAGRLLSSSFARLNARGITFKESLDLINKSTDKTKTATELYGVQSFTLGLILSDNIEKTAKLTKEFENAEGALKTLTDEQLKSLDAQLKILDSTWEKFILNVDNGNGAISRFILTMVTFSTGMITLFDSISQVSDGFFDFFINLQRVAQGQAASIVGEAITKRALEERKGLLDELSALMQEDFETRGLIIPQEKIMGDLLLLNNKALKDRIKLFEKLPEGGDGGDGGGSDGGGDDVRKVIEGTVEAMKLQIAALIKVRTETANTEQKYGDLTIQIDAATKAMEDFIKASSRQVGVLAPSVPTSGVIPLTGGISTPSIDETPPTTAATAPTSGRAKASGAIDDFLGSDTFNSSLDAFNAVTDLGNMLFDSKIALIDAEIQAESDKYALLIAMAEGDAEQQRLLVIEEEKELQKLEKKRRKELKKQAAFNKANAIIQIGINTAIAISNALASSGPPPLGIALAAIVGALGLAQIAVVASQPLPQFEKGGIMHKDGLAIVGDGGRKEVIKNPDGSIQVTPSKSTVVGLQKGAEVFPSIEAFNAESPMDISDKIYSATVMSSLSINNEKITSYLETQKIFNDKLLGEMIRNTEAIKKQKLRSTHNSQRIDIADELFKRQYD